MVTLELPSLLVTGADSVWCLRTDVDFWVRENLAIYPKLKVTRDSQWALTHQVLLSSIEILLSFESADEAMYFKLVWL